MDRLNSKSFALTKSDLLVNKQSWFANSDDVCLNKCLIYKQFNDNHLVVEDKLKYLDLYYYNTFKPSTKD